jgi:hypothetical protein
VHSSGESLAGKGKEEKEREREGDRVRRTRADRNQAGAQAVRGREREGEREAEGEGEGEGDGKRGQRVARQREEGQRQNSDRAIDRRHSNLDDEGCLGLLLAQLLLLTLFSTLLPCLASPSDQIGPLVGLGLAAKHPPTVSTVCCLHMSARSSQSRSDRLQ